VVGSAGALLVALTDCSLLEHELWRHVTFLHFEMILCVGVSDDGFQSGHRRKEKETRGKPSIFSGSASANGMLFNL